MKNYLKQFLAGALAVSLAVMSAGPAMAESAKTLPPDGGGYGKMTNLEFYGMRRGIVSLSTIASVIFAGEGFLDMVCSQFGTSGNYSLALDSGASAGGLTINSLSLALTPRVFTLSDTDSVNNVRSSAGAGCFSPDKPIRFVNGLTGVNSAAGITTIWYWHKSDGSNP